jgi:hypothetical protein
MEGEFKIITMTDIKKLLLTESKKYSSLLKEGDINLYKIKKTLLEERDFDELTNRLLLLTMAITKADGGTFYVLENNNLEINYAYNSTLKMSISPKPSEKKRAIPLFDKDNEPNYQYNVVKSAVDKITVNFMDIKGKKKESKASKKFDEQHNYKTLSVLSVPLIIDDEVFGVLQLINAQDLKSKTVAPFKRDQQENIESICKTLTPVLNAFKQGDAVEAVIQGLLDDLDAQEQERIREIEEAKKPKKVAAEEVPDPEAEPEEIEAPESVEPPIEKQTQDAAIDIKQPSNIKQTSKKIVKYVVILLILTAIGFYGFKNKTQLESYLPKIKKTSLDLKQKATNFYKKAKAKKAEPKQKLKKDEPKKKDDKGKKMRKRKAIPSNKIIHRKKKLPQK